MEKVVLLVLWEIIITIFPNLDSHTWENHSLSFCGRWWCIENNKYESTIWELKNILKLQLSCRSSSSRNENYTQVEVDHAYFTIKYQRRHLSNDIFNKTSLYKDKIQKDFKIAETTKGNNCLKHNNKLKKVNKFRHFGKSTEKCFACCCLFLSNSLPLKLLNKKTKKIAHI